MSETTLFAAEALVLLLLFVFIWSVMRSSARGLRDLDLVSRASVDEGSAQRVVPRPPPDEVEAIIASAPAPAAVPAAAPPTRLRPGCRLRLRSSPQRPNRSPLRRRPWRAPRSRAAPRSSRSSPRSTAVSSTSMRTAARWTSPPTSGHGSSSSPHPFSPRGPRSNSKAGHHRSLALQPALHRRLLRLAHARPDLPPRTLLLHRGPRLDQRDLHQRSAHRRPGPAQGPRRAANGRDRPAIRGMTSFRGASPRSGPARATRGWSASTTRTGRCFAPPILAVADGVGGALAGASAAQMRRRRGRGARRRPAVGELVRCPRGREHCGA